MFFSDTPLVLLRSPRSGLRPLLWGSLLLGLMPLLTGLGKMPLKKTTVELPAGSTVLCLGDSLTAGNGAQPGEDWPSLLLQSTGWNVINAGVAGDTSAQALERLPALLAEYKPRLTIVLLGGNDFLQRIRAERTTDSLRAILKQIQQAQSAAILVGVPSLGGVLGLRDHRLYADLSYEMHVPLYGRGWVEIFSRPALKSDQVHPNAEGYRIFTREFIVWLQKEGFLAYTG